MSTKSLDGPVRPTDPTHACVIFPGALGDFICFLPALRALTKTHPITLYAHSEFGEIVPRGVTLRSLEAAEVYRLFAAASPNDQAARAAFGAFGAVYSWLGSQEPAFIRALQSATGGRAKIFPFRPAGSEHQADYYRRCLGDSDALPALPSLEINAAALHWAKDFWTVNALSDRPVLAIAPGSGAREKNWAEEHFIDVADWWQSKIGGMVLLIVGPVEAERGGIDRLRPRCVTARELGLARLAALLARSRVYLGNDSGVSHLAAAVGTATLALFGPSDPRCWAPRGPRVSVLSRTIHCSPCTNTAMKACSERRCMNEISPGEVIASLLGLSELPSLTRGGVGITV
jgi:ADP-heptose:LPS heptosyltransferase